MSRGARVAAIIESIQSLDGPIACRRGHDRRVTGWRDSHGRHRCMTCDQMQRRQPLTPFRRRPSSEDAEGWQAILAQGSRRLNAAMLRLTADERRVVELRLGLDQEPPRPRTLRAIGEMMDPPRSRQYVDWVEKRAKRILRDVLQVRVS